MRLAGRALGGQDGVTLDRTVVVTGGALLVVTVLAWAAMLLQVPVVGAAPMAPGDVGIAPGDATAFLVAWTVMMAAMMLPSATPMIGLYSAVYRGKAGPARRALPTAVFTLVYLLVWLAFGIPVYALSVLVGRAAASDVTLQSALPYALAVVLVAAGAFQLSPLKRACLRVCRSPLAFLMSRWRAGYRGTFALGLSHAMYCVGCCWALMAVLVAAGAMSLVWVLLIALVVFAEKILPGGERTLWLSGVALILLGLLVAARPELAGLLRGAEMSSM
jgi:predicted metal-binding membrane protein